MKTKIEIVQSTPTENQFKPFSHHMLVIDINASNYPFADLLKNKLKRLGKKISDLAETSVTTEIANGAMISWVVYNPDLSMFKIHTQIRKAFHAIAAENPTELSISFLPDNISQTWVDACTYVCLANSQPLPNLKKGAKDIALKNLRLMGD